MSQNNANNRVALIAVGVVLLMGSLAWAAVPFYSWFCQVTGFGGTTGVAEVAPAEVLDKSMIIRFDGSHEPGLPWRFRPVQRQMEVRIGETGLAFFEAENLTDRPIAGQATYNITPDQAGGYFDKIACFCFTEQVLEPHEVVQMPVSFYVDPAIVDDPEAKLVHTITLSYTFYEIPLPEDYQPAGG